MTTDRSLHDVVDDLEPLILRHAEAAEKNRKMAPEVMSALAETGLLRMWIPKAYNGMETAPNDALGAMEALARIDAATGWVVSNCVFISMIYQFLPDTVVSELLGDPRAVTCGSFVPPGTAMATDDSYIVNGNWSFGSAAEYASSLASLTVLCDDHGPVVGEGDAPVSVLVFVDPQDVTFVDTWHTLGLRATGSLNYTMKDLQVRHDRALCSARGRRTRGPSPLPCTEWG